MLTIFSISESIRKLVEGGDAPEKPKYSMQEVKIAAVQIMNSLIKTQHLTEEMAAGEQIPDGTVLGEYDNIPVESYKNVSRATLPIMPVKIGTRNLGIFHVSRTDDIINGFIPFRVGELQMVGEEPLISDILGQVAYEPRGSHVIFNRDITDGDSETAITEVYMLLAVKDLSLYGDWDMLPIPASSEADVIQKTYEWLMGKQIPNRKVDVINKEEVKA